MFILFFFKQKTAYEMRISDWSSDVCSSDLLIVAAAVPLTLGVTFIAMLLTGRNIDLISLGALILSLGLLVDDAIIAIEIMVVRMQQGVDRVAAAAAAWSTTAAPMLSGRSAERRVGKEGVSPFSSRVSPYY